MTLAWGDSAWRLEREIRDDRNFACLPSQPQSRASVKFLVKMFVPCQQNTTAALSPDDKATLYLSVPEMMGKKCPTSARHRADDLPPGPAAARSCLTCATAYRVCVAVILRYLALSSLLVLLLRVPGDPSERHVIASSFKETSLGSWRVCFPFCMAISIGGSRL